jgi:Uma2 family endonuclease
MVMPDLVRRWTREEVLALPDDGKRYELCDGELLVTPAPSVFHQVALMGLYDLIAPFVKSHGLGIALLSPADLQLGGGQLSQPDLFVVPFLPPGREWPDFPTPTLVVEVLSPSTARADRLVKRRRYQRAGIPEYWIVDPDARAIERWRPGDERPEILDERLIWQPVGATSPLELDLSTFFRGVWGD